MKLTTRLVRAMALSDPMWESREPKREIVFPTGEPPGNDDRRWRFTQQDLAGVVAEFGERTELMPVFVSHKEDPEWGGKAAGWVDRLELAPDGLYAFIRYTDKALDEIRAGHWGYRSPGFMSEQDAEGFEHPRRLDELSIVNEPAIGGMPPIKAAKTEISNATPELPATDAGTTEATAVKAAKGGPNMDPLKKLAAVRKALDLPDTAGPNEIAAAFAEMMANAPAPEPEMDLEKEDKPADLPNPLAEAAASVKPRIELVEDGSAEKAVAEAEKAGKVTAAMRPGALKFASADPAGFASFVAASPVVAPPAGQVVTAGAGDRTAQKFTRADLGSPEKRAQISAAARAMVAREHISMDAAYARLLA